MSNIPRHKVFISYYHAEDQQYKDNIIRQNSLYNIFDNYSIRENDIDDTNKTSEQIRRIIRDDYMRNATVLLLLCGQRTKTRKHVDWEIHTAMYHSDANPQMGIVVVNLPTIHQLQMSSCDDDKKYFGYVNWSAMSKIRSDIDKNFPFLPDRVAENLTRNDIYTPIVDWSVISGNIYNLAGIIDVAYNNRYRNNYDYSTPLRRNNS